MNIQITSRKFRAKDSLKDFIKSELKSLEKFNDDIVEANVILSFVHMKDNFKTAEIVVKIPRRVLSVTETSEDFKKSITIANEKLIRQLKIIKSKKLARPRNAS